MRRKGGILSRLRLPFIGSRERKRRTIRQGLASTGALGRDWDMIL